MVKYAWITITCSAALSCLSAAAETIHREVSAFAAFVVDFIRWGFASVAPKRSEGWGEVNLYEVNRSRAENYAAHRRAGFDPRHVDQGWLAAA